MWGDERMDVFGRVVRVLRVIGWMTAHLCVPNPGESAGHCGSLHVHQPES